MRPEEILQNPGAVGKEREAVRAALREVALWIAAKPPEERTGELWDRFWALVGALVDEERAELAAEAAGIVARAYLPLERRVALRLPITPLTKRLVQMGAEKIWREEAER